MKFTSFFSVILRQVKNFLSVFPPSSKQPQNSVKLSFCFYIPRFFLDIFLSQFLIFFIFITQFFFLQGLKKEQKKKFLLIVLLSQSFSSYLLAKYFLYKKIKSIFPCVSSLATNCYDIASFSVLIQTLVIIPLEIMYKFYFYKYSKKKKNIIFII